MAGNHQEPCPNNNTAILEKKRQPGSSISLKHFFTGVLPQVSRELKRWNKQLDYCRDWTLMMQAMSSLRQKKFHSQGGSFFALYSSRYRKELVTLIVALQTISDYLDNLCDRADVYHEAAFRYLHRSMIDALSLQNRQNTDYYRFFPYRDDGGYLQALVQESSRQIAVLPAYASVEPEIKRLAALYNDLQVYKHLKPGVRRSRLKNWFRDKARTIQPPLPGVYWWEFAAACGSTLAIFALLAAASTPETGPGEVKKIVRVYFPWICGLHILLDYWIDQEEDRKEGDFNFVACYPSPAEAALRLAYFVRKSLECASRLPHSRFHLTIVQGLLAVYLSDPKVKKQGLYGTARQLIAIAGPETMLYYRICCVLRKTGIL